MADIARIEERIDRVAVGAMEVSDALGGLRFQNMVEVMEFAKMMSVAGNAVPKHLQGNPGMCLAVCVQALEWRFSPFAVANKSYEVQSRLSFESQLVHAVIEQRAPITGRLRHTFTGDGDDRRCVVTAVLRETGETLEYISPPISKITPKNSPLWKTKPDLQLYYNTSRDFCRVYFPDVLLGVYAEDELRDHVGPDHAKDVTDKPGVASRLKGSKGRGFSAAHVERETTRGVIDETTSQTEAQREAGDKPLPPASQAADPQASEKEPVNTDSGEATGIASASPLNSSEASAPLIPASDDARAVAPGGAGATSSPDGSNSPRAGEPKQTSEPGNSALHGFAGLPPDWTTQYAAALKKALKFPALPKCAAAYWDTVGGWSAHKTGPNAETAVAIYRAFEQHFPDHEKRDAILRELGVA